MFKHLRIWIPVLQVLLVVSVFAWTKFGTGRMYDYYAHGVRDLVIHLNFPLAVVWIAISLPFRGLRGYIANIPDALTSGVIALLIAGMALSVGAFWYLVVGEVEKRTHGLSMLRPSSRLMAVVALIALTCFGSGALWYAYVVSRPMWYVARRGAILTGLFPTIWGTIFVCMAIVDFMMLLNRGKSQHDRESHPGQT